MSDYHKASENIDLSINKFMLVGLVGMVATILLHIILGVVLNISATFMFAFYFIFLFILIIGLIISD